MHHKLIILEVYINLLLSLVMLPVTSVSCKNHCMFLGYSVLYRVSMSQMVAEDLSIRFIGLQCLVTYMLKSIVTQCRSIAKNIGCFQQNVFFVCVFVGVLVNTITSKRVNVG